MRKKLVRGLLTLSAGLLTLTAVAQPAIPRDYVETPGFSMGINFGMTDLWGDVGTKSLVDHYYNSSYWDKPCFMGGMFVRYLAHPMLAGRLSINYGTLYATDHWNKNKAKKATSIEDDAYQRYIRNQDARANIWEGSLMLEFNPLRYNSESRAAQKKMQPYLLVGIGGFHFRPQTTLVDPITRKTKWVDTRDLHLEGEGIRSDKAQPGYARKTSLWQVNVPVGLGLRWDIGHDMAIGVEYLYRFCFTDRLDNVSSEYAGPDYYDRALTPENAYIAKQVYDKSWVIDPSVTRKPWSQRGNKEVLDAYSTISINFIYKINDNKIPWWF